MKAKQKLAMALERLLQKKSLDDITVSEIIEEAEVARKTFYRNFCDKYALMNWYYDGFYRDSFGSIAIGADFGKALVECLAIYDSKRKLLQNAYSSKDRNGLKNHDIEVTRMIYETCLLNKGVDISSWQMRFAIEIAVRGGCDMVEMWIQGEWNLSKEQLASCILQTLPEDIRKYL